MGLFPVNAFGQLQRREQLSSQMRGNERTKLPGSTRHPEGRQSHSGGDGERGAMPGIKGPGRATGERLWLQRGRLTPRSPALRTSHSRAAAQPTTRHTGPASCDSSAAHEETPQSHLTQRGFVRGRCAVMIRKVCGGTYPAVMQGLPASKGRCVPGGLTRLDPGTGEMLPRG
jgi:hypothetical protein